MKKKLLTILAAIMAHFPGRRAYLPIMAAVSVLGLGLFLIFPPVPLTPVAYTGGGAPLVHSGRVVHGILGQSAHAKSAARHYLTLNPGDAVDLSPGPVTLRRPPRAPCPPRLRAGGSARGDRDTRC